MKVWLDSGLIIFCQEDLIGNGFQYFMEFKEKFISS